jgi:signal transduction histidine kinase
VDLLIEPADVGAVEMVPQEIGRVLINLLDNAFDAVRQRAARNGTAYQPAVRVTMQRLRDEVEIRVHDNGTGIPEDHLGRVFEPFFTTKPTGEGTGLGLSLAYDIVTQGHRGSLAAESGIDGGTVLRMLLPAT